MALGLEPELPCRGRCGWRGLQVTADTAIERPPVSTGPGGRAAASTMRPGRVVLDGGTKQIGIGHLRSPEWGLRDAGPESGHFAKLCP